jgi:hypothetical protein
VPLTTAAASPTLSAVRLTDTLLGLAVRRVVDVRPEIRDAEGWWWAVAMVIVTGLLAVLKVSGLLRGGASVLRPWT